MGLLLLLVATAVGITGDTFTIDGRPTYPGTKLEGLLMNSRMVQGIFDDANPETRGRWAYKDTGKWDPERNTREFIAAMPEWRKHGLLGFTINLQGGSPEGYSKSQPWRNSAFAPDGSLRPDHMARLKRILDRADQLGMVAIVGYFYFGQDQELRDEAAVKRGIENASRWLRRYKNVLVEVANEINIKSYDHEILKPPRAAETIKLVRSLGLRAGTSYGGGRVPDDAVVAASDFILIHGNGVKDPSRIAKMVAETRAMPSYRPMPILFNEDDHFDFDKPVNNMSKAIEARASWGYFDPEGYQCPPVSWGIDTDRKRAFFTKLRELTSPPPAPR